MFSLRYGTPELIILLIFKKSVGSFGVDETIWLLLAMHL